jgi:hypothetical protein
MAVMASTIVGSERWQYLNGFLHGPNGLRSVLVLGDGLGTGQVAFRIQPLASTIVRSERWHPDFGFLHGSCGLRSVLVLDQGSWHTHKGFCNRAMASNLVG